MITVQNSQGMYGISKSYQITKRGKITGFGYIRSDGSFTLGSYWDESAFEYKRSNPSKKEAAKIIQLATELGFRIGKVSCK